MAVNYTCILILMLVSMSQTKNDNTSSITRRRNLATEGTCSKPGQTCKEISKCASIHTRSLNRELCTLPGTNSTTGTGICCPDLLPKRVRKKHLIFKRNIEEELEAIGNMSFIDLMEVPDAALQYMEKLHELEDRISKDETLKVRPQTPAAGHLMFTSVSEDARLIALKALELGETTKIMASLLGSSDINVLRKVNITEFKRSANGGCPIKPHCPTRPSKYRMNDGSCNNMCRPWVGQAMTVFQRLLPADYADGIDKPRLNDDGYPLPDPRNISLLLSPDRINKEEEEAEGGAGVEEGEEEAGAEGEGVISNIIVNKIHEARTLARSLEAEEAEDEAEEANEPPADDSITAFLADFGQFIDHDMTLSPVFTLAGGAGIQCCLFDGSGIPANHKMHPECLPIMLPVDDPQFAEFNQRCMNFVRTMPALPYDCALGARQQMNAVTHYIDASMVYGNSDKEVRALRGKNGKLRTGSESKLLPPQSDSKCIKRTPRDNKEFCFMAGDPRVIEQPLQTSLQALFMQEHNRIADILHKMHSDWCSTDVFEEARRIMVAELQHITYNEFLLALLGPKYSDFFQLTPLLSGYSNLYDKDLDGSISNEFATAGFRLHSLVLGTLKFKTEMGQTEEKLLRFFFDSPQILDWPRAGDDLIRGQCSRSSGAFDTRITEDMTDYMFQINDAKGQDTFGFDIFSLNVNRGRDHGLRGYNDYRVLCGLPRAHSFDDLEDSMDEDALKKIKELYTHVDDIDLFVGGSAETTKFGSVLGPTFICIIGDQFARSRRGDRYFYDVGNQPSSFTKEQLQEIRKTSLARIICDNSLTIKNIQPQVFFNEHLERNPIVSCSSNAIPSVSLLPWKEEHPERRRRRSSRSSSEHHKHRHSSSEPVQRHSRPSSSEDHSHRKSSSNDVHRHSRFSSSEPNRPHRSSSSEANRPSRSSSSEADRHRRPSRDDVHRRSRSSDSESDRHHRTSSSESDRRSRSSSSESDRRSRSSSSESDRPGRSSSSEADRPGRSSSSEADRHRRSSSSESDGHRRSSSSEADRRSRSSSSEPDRRSRSSSSESDRPGRSSSSEADRPGRSSSSDADRRSRSSSSEADRHRRSSSSRRNVQRDDSSSSNSNRRERRDTSKSRASRRRERRDNRDKRKKFIRRNKYSSGSWLKYKFQHFKPSRGPRRKVVKKGG